MAGLPESRLPTPQSPAAESSVAEKPLSSTLITKGSSASFDSRPLKSAYFLWPHSIPGNPGAPGNPDGPYDPGIIQGKVTPINDNTWNCELTMSEKSPPHAPFLRFFLVDSHGLATQNLGTHRKLGIRNSWETQPAQSLSLFLVFRCQSIIY